MANNIVREEMTVHQALCELKTLNKRIEKAINETKPISTKEHSSLKVDGMTTAEFKNIAQSNHDSAVDLIRRQRGIKSAINQYNASKTVEICGRAYTIAQAIWEMKYAMAEEKNLLGRYSAMLNRATVQMERANGEELNRRAEAAMNAIHGSKDKANNEEYLKGIEDYKASHTLELVDPLDVRKIIADLDKEISEFEAKVDAAIQVANATTTLTIEY